jgi:hypothetical protein
MMVFVSVAANLFVILFLFSLPSRLCLYTTPSLAEDVGAGASSPYSSDTNPDTPSFSLSSDVPFIFPAFALFFLPNLLPPPTIVAAS